MRTVEFVVLPTTRTKAKKMFQIAGACRYVWNHFREKNLAGYQAFKNGKGERPQTSYFSLGVEFTRLRHETEWMRELPANPVKHTLKYFADALKEAMAGKKGFPKPRSRKRAAPSFTIPSSAGVRIRKVNKKYSSLLIPLVGWVTLARGGGAILGRTAHPSRWCFAMTGTDGVPLSLTRLKWNGDRTMVSS